MFRFMIFICMLLGSIFGIKTYALNECFNKNVGSICYFDSLSESGNDEANFYCSVNYSAGVKMTNHHVLVSGFLSGNDVGAGTYTYVGTDVKKFLKTYYFTVKNDPKRSGGVKWVYMVSMGDIHCNIGTGGRSKALPGLYGKLY